MRSGCDFPLPPTTERDSQETGPENNWPRECRIFSISLLRDRVCLITIQALLPTYQEARGVVQEAAETTDEASLQEGGVLRRKLVRVVGDQGRAGERLFVCETKQHPYINCVPAQCTQCSVICGTFRATPTMDEKLLVSGIVCCRVAMAAFHYPQDRKSVV